ncbi:hypothetical protein PV328_011741 [Microctonus aethiopoides]|uniref:Uncharacterized protein n=1 Tax=Microctonus aethiopoides TaxID=144406 RepID=A0AA39EUR5_9HYME|nr:hypothetical protein PV328_011741 [Microctonus aethiopoides]
MVVTPARIGWAVDAFDKYKNPGSDGIFPALLQKGEKRTSNYMDVHAKYTSMFNATVSDVGDMCISRCHSLNFADDINQQLIEFLNNEFGLTIYHKPIVSVLEMGDDDVGNDDGERVVAIMNES